MSLLLLFNKASASYTLNVTTGAYVISGNAVAVTKGYKLSVTTGTYTINGNAVAVTSGHNLSVATGAYTIGGNAVTLSYVATVAAVEAGTILMPGKAGGTFSRKKWREIQEQEAAERRIILEAQKQARDAAAKVKADAQAARAAKIAAKADVVAERTRLEAVVLASDTAKQFADQSSKEEAEFLAAIEAERIRQEMEQEDEDDVMMLLMAA